MRLIVYSRLLFAIALTGLLSGCITYQYPAAVSGVDGTTYYQQYGDGYGVGDDYGNGNYYPGGLNYAGAAYYPWWSLDYFYLGDHYYSPYYSGWSPHFSLQLGYGSPYWSYSYYSPYFYPHYFSFWYPSWYGHYYRGYRGGYQAYWRYSFYNHYRNPGNLDRSYSHDNPVSHPGNTRGQGLANEGERRHQRDQQDDPIGRNPESIQPYLSGDMPVPSVNRSQEDAVVISRSPHKSRPERLTPVREISLDSTIVSRTAAVPNSQATSSRNARNGPPRSVDRSTSSRGSYRSSRSRPSSRRPAGSRSSSGQRPPKPRPHD